MLKTRTRRRLAVAMPRYHVTISGQGYEAMADLVRAHHVSVIHKTVRHKGTQQYTVDAIVDEHAIERLTAAGYTVERHHDVDEVGRERQKEVGQGDRYARS
jgi:hypothetical protein